MGNKTSSGRNSKLPLPPAGSTSSNDVTRQNPAPAGGDGRKKKMISCPDLSASHGAVPYQHDVRDSTKTQLDVKIYRSYSNVAEASRRSSAAQPRPDIRVYRRSTAGPPSTEPTATERSQTLPRGFGRSKSNATSSTNYSARTANSDSLTLPSRGRSLSNQSDLKRQSALGLTASAALVNKRNSSTASMASIGYKVNSEDFPDTVTIKRRLTQFEVVFTRALSRLYCSMPESRQLSTLSIALRPDRANQHVSLAQYLTSSDIPLDLLADPEQFCLTIQPALFSGVMHARKDRPGDQGAALALASELVVCLAAEAAGEIARVFEYQIALLREGLSIELVASHAAHCVMEFLARSGRLLDLNAIVHGVVKGKHAPTTGISPKLSVIIGERELKWELQDVFRKPALRKELFLFSSNPQTGEDGCPWHFFTSYHHNPMLYGYRALIIDWDFTSVTETISGHGSTMTTVIGGYRLSGEDEASFAEEMDWRPDDFHCTYRPYRRLVGSMVVDEFLRYSGVQGTSPEIAIRRRSASLAEYVNKLHGKRYSRDSIQAVYRPIGDSVRQSAAAAAAAAGRDQDALFTMATPQHGYYSNGGGSHLDYSSNSEASASSAPRRSYHSNDSGGHVGITVAPPTVTSSQPQATTRELKTVAKQQQAFGSHNGDVIERRVVTVETTVCDDINGNDSGELNIDGTRDQVVAESYVIDESKRRTIRSDL